MVCLGISSTVTIPDVRIGHMQESGTGVLVRCVSSDENAQLQWYSVDITIGTAPVPVPIDERLAKGSFLSQFAQPISY